VTAIYEYIYNALDSTEEIAHEFPTLVTTNTSARASARASASARAREFKGLIPIKSFV